MKKLWSKVRRKVVTLIRPPQMAEMELFSRILEKEDSGLMIDVGAHHGDSLRWFADRGWTVHAFEPDPANRERLVHMIQGRRNVHIDMRAVSDRIQGEAVLYKSGVSTGISGLSAFHPSHEPASVVEVTTLSVYAREAQIDSIDLLKIDAEGFDLHVLRGLDWSRHQPRFIMCEFEDSKTLPLGYTYRDLGDFLTERGYQVLVSEWKPIVAYGADHHWRRFGPYPAELSDTAAWGNLLACRDPTDWDALRRLSRSWQRGVRWREAVASPVRRMLATISTRG